MKVYLVVGSGYFKKGIYDFYCLKSYHYLSGAQAETLHLYKDFILDSGIFTFLSGKQKKVDLDWYEYAHKYAAFVKKHSIRNYVEIDVDKFVGLAEVEKIRAYLDKTVGWKCMPVWHIARGWDKWLEICRDYPYVCFGAFLTDGLPKNKYRFIPKFLEAAAARNSKVHGLGFTAMEGLRRYKFYSVDSSTWTIGNRFGAVFRFTGDTIEIHKKRELMRISDQHKLAAHNLNEWIKFSEYADQYL